MTRHCLYIVACGAPPANEALRAVEMAHAAGMDAAVIPTPMGVRFLGDVGAVEAATGFPVRTDYRRPEDPDVLPLPSAILVSPLSFNTLNAWAAGLSPTLALGLINEALGMGIPVAAVPWVNAQLSRHPAALESVARLRSAGVSFTSGFAHPSSRIPGPDGKTRKPVYPWDEIEASVRRMAAEVGAVAAAGGSTE